jgi:hypothetical protein
VLTNYFLRFLEELLGKLDIEGRDTAGDFLIDSFSIAADNEILADEFLKKSRCYRIRRFYVRNEVLAQTDDLISSGIVSGKVIEELKDRINSGNVIAANRLIKFLGTDTVDSIGIESNLQISDNYRIIFILTQHTLLIESAVLFIDFLNESFKLD